MRQNIINFYRKGGKKLPDDYYNNIYIEDDVFFVAKSIVGHSPSAVKDELDEYELALLHFFFKNFDPNNHETYPFHSTNCDGRGVNSNCLEREEKIFREIKEKADVDRKTKAGLKEIEILTKDIAVGDLVKFYWDSKIGIIEKINKVSYTIKHIGKENNDFIIKSYRFDPRFVNKISSEDLAKFFNHEIGDQVKVKCYDGHKRDVEILDKVEEIFYLIKYEIKSSKEVRTCWIDPLRFLE